MYSYSDINCHSFALKYVFENLKLKEEKFGFYEAPINFKTGERKKFFNLGPDNDWEKFLDKNIIQEINEKFKTEMKELGYIV